MYGKRILKHTQWPARFLGWQGAFLSWVGTTWGATLSSTYRQVLWGKSAQPCQVPPGGSVELLHLLCQLLLEAPLLFVLLSISELHHDRWRAALWSDTLESEEGVTAGSHPLGALSQHWICLSQLRAHGMVWDGLRMVWYSFFFSE